MIANTIKEIVRNYINYAKLSDILFGTVVNKNPIKVSIDKNSNLNAVGEPFIVVTDRFKKEPLEVGERIVLIRAQGGQKFVILDKL